MIRVHFFMCWLIILMMSALGKKTGNFDTCTNLISDTHYTILLFLQMKRTSLMKSWRKYTPLLQHQPVPLLSGLSALPSGPAAPCSYPIASHYSFDMAQQVHYPCDPLQPGPMYFLTPRKCGVFGVCNEAILRQVNFLIEEACDTGKGANNIINHQQAALLL